MTVSEIFDEAGRRGIGLISIADHDTIEAQEEARTRAGLAGIRYLCGLELNVSFAHPGYRDGRPISLDFLGYGFDPDSEPLVRKLEALRAYREERAAMILEKINAELARENLAPFTQQDMEAIQSSVEGAFGRPHIAEYMVAKGVVATRQEAFDRYLVKCNVPKMPLSLEEASGLVRGAGGRLMLAHPNHPWGTSLIAFTPQIEEQQVIIEARMLPYIDGIECWHSQQDAATTASYLAFAERLGLLVTGGSDCHQNPILMGTVDVPPYVAEQFGL